MEIKNVKTIHMVGIKGAGMSALAKIFKSYGFVVTGSDVAEEFFTDKILQEQQIQVFSPYAESNLRNPDLVVAWSACEDSNPEVAKALSLGIPVLRYPEALAMITQGKFTIAVCGTHGKTTTTAFVGLVFAEAGLDPTVILGSEVKQFGGNSRSGKSEYMVIEACEYKRHFLKYDPKVIVLTNIEMDHPDCYKDLSEVKKTFREFIEKLKGHELLIACSDNQNVKDILKFAKCRVITYGFNPNPSHTHFQIVDIKEEIGKTSFSLFAPFGFSPKIQKYVLKIPGRHNIQNASAAIVLANFFNLPFEKIKKAVSEFSGAKRRFEKIGEAGGIIVVDDYAHHPTEIRATLQGARKFYPQSRIWAIFQPHTFSRTKGLFTEFSEAFSDADFVILQDIFSSAREKDTGEINSQMLVRAIQKNHPNAFYMPDASRIIDLLGKKAREGDVVITLGAGDVYKIGQRILKEI
jgi:UDP-N-acetylmuramate--alanine ligase